MYSHNKIPISGSSNRVGRAFRGADPSVPLKSNAALPALQSTKILDQVRERIRYLHFSIRTEQSYLYWIRFYIRWSGTRHPREMGAPEVTSFLTFLANERNVSVSTHRVALSALLFLYQKVLEVNMPWLDGLRHHRSAHEHRRQQAFDVAIHVVHRQREQNAPPILESSEIR